MKAINIPERPPKRWIRHCIKGVEKSGGADNPGAVCGDLWWNKKTPKERKQIIKEEESKKRKKKGR